MKLHLLDLGRLDYDEGFPLVADAVSTLSDPPAGLAPARPRRVVPELSIRQDARTEATLVCGHDADVLTELKREKFYD